MDIQALLQTVPQRKASDLHLAPGRPPLMRISGDVAATDSRPLEADTIRNMLNTIMTEEQRHQYEADHEVDFAVSVGGGARFRVNAYTTHRGPAAAFRLIPQTIPTLADLNCPPIFQRLAERERGVVLVTGPTGSGKSTTLAAMIDHLNRTTAKHILTIEDPIEFVHEPQQALINQREVGEHTNSFARALKSALREDPDVILVGEMRDHETISLALTAAETGHLVFGTLHTSSAPKTIDRIIDVFPSGDKEMVRAMLSESLQSVISQTLLKRKDGSGRVAAHEILLGTNAVRNLIRENKIPQMYSMIQMGRKVGMQTMEDSVQGLVDQELVGAHEMERFQTPEEQADNAQQQQGGQQQGQQQQSARAQKAKQQAQAQQQQQQPQQQQQQQQQQQPAQQQPAAAAANEPAAGGASESDQGGEKAKKRFKGLF